MYSQHKFLGLNALDKAYHCSLSYGNIMQSDSGFAIQMPV